MTGTVKSSRERAEALMERMTTLEKAQQLSSALAGTALDEAGRTRELTEGIGHISLLQVAADSPAGLARFANTVQRFLRERTRLGIPAILHNEALNGVAAAGFTSFPTAIALAATWDPPGVQQMAATIRRQMRAVGQTQALSPVVDIARDARWGRTHETYGEDVLLTSAMGVHFVRGIQGTDLSEGVLATAKHFLGYAASEAGLNISASVINPRELYDVYATPFEAMVKEAGLACVMNSYAEVDGVPAAANPALLRGLLRDRIGFEGVVVADYASLDQLVRAKKVARDHREAGTLALRAGLDVELPSTLGYGRVLADAVEAGLVERALLDEAVLRVLIQKYDLGLFDDPYVGEDPVVLQGVAREGGDLSLRLARESVTLLKNDGVLPLADGLRRIAVIGPHARSALGSFANYTYPATVATLQGMATGENRMVGVEGGDVVVDLDSPMIRIMQRLATTDLEDMVRREYGAVSLSEALGQALPGSAITSADGCGILAGTPEGLAEAVRLAQDADLVVLAIGGRCGGAGWDLTEGEGTDSSRVELPACQADLVRAVAATGKPLAAVVWMGRPYALADLDPLFGAVLTAYYPGPHGARALADVLAGHESPQGRLPFTIPRSTGQVPIHYSQKNGSGYARADAEGYAGYIDLPATPLYPFGHGLTYTAFDYEALRTEPERVDIAEAFTVRVKVTNNGSRAGTEVVQVYLGDVATGVTRPGRQLAGFARADLDPGKSADVSVTISTRQLGYTGLSGQFLLEPGPVSVMVGASSADIRAEGRVDVTGVPENLSGRRAYLPEVEVTPA
ncbi:glycoside hydrolase family 3 N-terminal domain-containing protein [Streptomyces sp. NPDC048291]|uniref:glycoside hydrolase family 3 N-terminal domain-containing protein n=1 Tax=Streptomyces sp. NPDC048291 TaxID=3365530 RepID=UPI00372130FF